MFEGSSRENAFVAFAQALVPLGWSGNAIIGGARELGFGIQRERALDVIREIRSAADQPRPSAFAGPTGPFEPAAPSFRWGQQVQETDQWQRFDGPNSILFQTTGVQMDQWLDYVIVPEDEDFVSQRFVVEDDDYVDPDRPGSGYRTTQPLPADISASEAARRLGIDSEKIARIIYDRP